MKPTPFNPDTDLAPIPFSQELCQTAEQLKQNGLLWHPHVGCFVWDKEQHIPVSSPFPHRIYLILNMGHFLKIFQTQEKIVKKLVWLPTWHQARQICEQFHIPSEKISKKLISEKSTNNELFYFYQIIIKEIKKKPQNE